MKANIGGNYRKRQIEDTKIKNQIEEAIGSLRENEVSGLKDVILELQREEAQIPSRMPTFDEVKSGIDDMKNGKCSEPDEITAEMWKTPKTARLIYDIISRSWSEGVMPDECYESNVVAIPKKKGFRTISLINSAAKIFCQNPK